MMKHVATLAFRVAGLWGGSWLICNGLDIDMVSVGTMLGAYFVVRSASYEDKD